MKKSIKTILSLILSAGMLFAVGCGGNDEESGSNPTNNINGAEAYAALKAEIANYGTNFTRTMSIHSEGYGVEDNGQPVSLGYVDMSAVSAFDGDKVQFLMSGDRSEIGYLVCYDGTAVYESNGNFSKSKYACDIETFMVFSYIPQTFVSVTESQLFDLPSSVLANSTVKVENDEILISCSLSGDEALTIWDKTLTSKMPAEVEYSNVSMDYVIHATSACKFKYIEITMDYDYKLNGYPISTKDNTVKIEYSNLGTTEVTTPANASAYTLTEIPQMPQA